MKEELNNKKDISASSMTLRDYFAAKAMQSLVQSTYFNLSENWTTDDIAEQSYYVADQMLFAREQEG